MLVDILETKHYIQDGSEYRGFVVVVYVRSPYYIKGGSFVKSFSLRKVDKT